MTNSNARRMPLLFIAVFATLPLGCVSEHYEVHLKPKDAEIERSLVAWTNVQDAETGKYGVPAKVMERANKHYPNARRDESGKLIANATFDDEMPSDVGGAGYYAYYDSPFGSVSIYSERFRGEDDFVVGIEERTDAVDSFADLLVQWCAQEFSGSAHLEKIRKFIDTDLRRDLKNLAIRMFWVGDTMQGGDPEHGKEFQFLARFVQYLLERDYIEVNEIPQLTRVLEHGSDDQKLSHFLAALFQKTGIPFSETKSELAVLFDPDQTRISINKHLQDSEIYKNILADWKSLNEEKSDAPDEPANVLLGLATLALLPPGFGSGRSLHVRLETGVKPLDTNGIWEVGTSSVQWNAPLNDRHSPTQLFASWCVPNESKQETVLGRVVLRSDDLVKYAFWYRGLSAQERTEWDEFIDSLDPAEEIQEKLKAFEFSGNEKLAEAMCGRLARLLDAEEPGTE